MSKGLPDSLSREDCKLKSKKLWLGNVVFWNALITCPNRQMLCRQKCMPHDRQRFHEWPPSLTFVRAARISSGYVLRLMDEGSYLSTLVMVRHRDQHS